MIKHYRCDLVVFRIVNLDLSALANRSGNALVAEGNYGVLASIPLIVAAPAMAANSRGGGAAARTIAVRYSIFSQNPRRFGILGKTSWPS